MMKKGFECSLGLAFTGRLLQGLLTGLAVGAIALAETTLLEAIRPRPVSAAEEIRLTIGGPVSFSVSVDSLETFSETGEIQDDLRLLTRFMSDENQATLRQVLQTKIPYDVVQIDNILYSTLGQDALQNFGKIIKPHPDINGFKGLRGAFITAAAQAGPDGWTLIDVIRKFPSQSVDLNGGELLTLRRSLAVYFSYNTAVIEAIQAQAAEVATKQASVSRLKDLEEPGPYAFERNTLTLFNSALRQTTQGIRLNYDFNVETYLPQGLLKPAPVVIISHGFGDVRDSFDFLAAHLASHGFAVVIPDHVGSDLDIRRSFLQGDLNTILSPTEFISRPQEVSFVIDELERLVATSPDWAAKLNLDQIGMVGDSLGATTALASAGAEINYARISAGCDRQQFILNLAQYLLCQARYLPPRSQQLSDERIKGAIASHAMGGGLYGPEGIGQIEIPLMILSGSNDIVAPAVAEQVHPFIWAGSEEKYLALLTTGTHFTAKPGRPGGAEGIISLLVGENRDVGARYFKALNVAFWNRYLRQQASYQPYLSARYAQQLSEGEPLQLDVIRELTPETLERAYGQAPPIAIIPEPVTSVAASPARGESVLAEIRRTGTLKVALRQDSFPFGYVNSESTWAGYCRAFAADLRTELEQTLAVRVQLVELASTFENRFSLVQDNTAHVECGPNAIRSDIEGITFSTPFLISGTQFLTRRSQVGDKPAPSNSTANFRSNPVVRGTRVAIVPGTTTERFILEEFPDAKRVLFPGPSGRSEAIRALAEGRVDVLASAGILSLGEVQRQRLPYTDFTLTPPRPLTCEFYGLVLPAGDAEWQTLLDNFITRTNVDRLDQEVPPNLLENQLETVDFCLNQSSG
ncbi:MAG: alpha/beta fold hydrolase [Cyanobacteria bacterium J06597_16]